SRHHAAGDGGRRDPADEGPAGPGPAGLPDRDPAVASAGPAGERAADQPRGDRGPVLGGPGISPRNVQSYKRPRPAEGGGGVPPVRACLRGGGAPPGGIAGYPLDRVYQEVAYLGRRVHWTHEELINFDHAERRRWVEEVLKLEDSP